MIKQKFCEIFIIFICLLSFSSFADDSYKSNLQNIPNKKTNKQFLGNKAEKVLEALKWSDFYERDRKKDIKYLLGYIKGKVLENLSDSQRVQVVSLVQEAAIDQLLKDKFTYRQYILDQYNQFFTADELDKLIQYFNTELMQNIIKIRFEQKSLSSEEIKDMLIKAKEIDKKIINDMTDSYLYLRFTRFQEKVGPALKKMIVERMKVVLEYTLDKLPEFTDFVKTNGASSVIEAPAK